MSMNDDQLDDLKQFIDSRISQTEARLTQRIDGLELKIDNHDKRFDELEAKVDDGFAGIGEALDVAHKDTDERLTRLEQQPA
jgi:hypothetical protein